MYKYLIRPVLFLFDPEAVHHFSFRAIKFFSILGLGGLFRKIFVVNDRRLEREVFGVKFKNPVGLAAGFDKDAKLYNEFSDFGFGFVEIGTVTPKPQPGNPKKRLFRLRDDQAIINRMGFNNKGVFDAVEQLKKKHRVIVGGNIGKNKVTPNDEALKDYLICFEALYEHVDYFVVNVSSPNTPGLRELQDKEPLTKLLKKLKNQNKKLAKNHQRKEKPILLKIAPDLTDDQLLDIIEIVADTKIDGVIATNTTIARQNLKSHLTLTEEMGGLSGKPLTNRSTEVIRFLSENSRKAFPIIGVGGIHAPEDALEKLEAGADLVQLYTGFIYEGPGLIKKNQQGHFGKNGVGNMESLAIFLETIHYPILIGFFLSALALALSPGPDNIFVLTQSMGHGTKSGLAVVFGLVSGCLVHTTLLAFGVSEIIKRSDALFFIIKLFGALYLLFLAMKVYKSDASISLEDGKSAQKSGKKLFWTGFTMNVLNPKVTIFFLAFFPGFLFSETVNTVVQFYVLGLIFMLSATLVFGMIAFLAGSISNYLKHHKKAGLYLKWMQIIVFVGIAIYLFVSDK